MDADSPVAAAGGAQGIGRTLAQAREALKLSREQCAERLYLPIDVINALEDERFDALGAGVYARGHLRRYAGLLGTDSAALERELLLQGNEQPNLAGIATKALPMEKHSRPRSRIRFHPLPWLIGLVVIAAVALIIWAVKSRPRAPSNGTTTTVLSAPPAAATPPAPAAGAATATANMRLGVTFVADGQVEVRDASNKVLYSKPGKAGSVVMLQGNAPFQITTGGPGNIAVQLDSRPVALPPATGTAPVRITVDATGAASLAPTTPAARIP